MNELRSSPVPGSLSSVSCFMCPNCNSCDLKQVPLIYAAGIVESRSRFCGIFLGSGDGFLFGAHRGKSQSRLSEMIGPPKKLPYAGPAILWLLGLFMLMAFDGRGKLSWLMGMISAVYILAIPAYFLVALFHNLLVRPKKHEDWERKSMCQRCWALIEPPTVTTDQASWGAVSRGKRARERGRAK